MSRFAVTLLGVILLVAASLRLYRLGHSPPGFHVDEATVAWDAYCLLKTGHDASGARWPVFYTRGLGDNRSTPMIYATLPFQAIGGLTPLMSRLPAALAGVLAVFLAFLIGDRLFDRTTGLAAAGLMALSPWHLQFSRWGHDSTLCPLLVLAPVAALLVAGLPLTNRRATPRPWLAGLAGATAGAACYGYPAVRIFLPLLLAGAVALNWRGWRESLRTRRGALSVAAAVLGLGLTFGPLLHRHLTDPAIGKRGAMTWVWSPSDSAGQRVLKVLRRYPGHFSPSFLFEKGTPAIDVSPPEGYGLFYWYELALMLGGLIAAVSTASRSVGARLVLLWVVLYPVGDLLSGGEAQNVLRCLPGLPGLILLEGVGAVRLGRWVISRWPRMGLRAVPAIAILAMLLDARFLVQFFGDYDRRWDKYFAFQEDLREAGEWLRPRFDHVDAVVCTGTGILVPYVHLLVSLRYDPHRWLASPPTVVPGPLPTGDYRDMDVVTGFGKVRFLYEGLPVPAMLGELAANGRSDRVIFIVRPGELELEKRYTPAYEVRSPRDEPVLWVFDVTL